MLWLGALSLATFVPWLLAQRIRLRSIIVEVFDEGFYEVLIFWGLRWTPLGEDGVIDLVDVAIEAWFIWDVEVPVPVPGLDLPKPVPLS